MKKLLFSVILLFTIAAVFSGCQSEIEYPPLERGSISENTYHSDYSGLNFTLPDTNWQFSTDEELANMMSISVDALNNIGLNTSQEMMELTTIYDMSAINPFTGSNVIVLYENLAASIGGMQYNEEDYINTVNDYLSQASYYENLSFGEITEVTVSGHTYFSQEQTATISGIPVAQYYFVRKIDNYMLSIVVTVFSDDDIESIMSNFS